MTEEWEHRAACGPADAEKFFSSEYVDKRAVIRDYCRHCPVRMECLGRALDEERQVGIRGGYTARQRRDMLREIEAGQ